MAGKSYQVGFVFGAKKASSFDGTFKSIGSSIKGIGKAVAGIAGAYIGVSAIKNSVVEVVKQFGELEQNLGGSEAVFGRYAESIQKAGEKAYKNLGVSQSDYLATANKMGALFQGSGIEQAQSLALTEKAMQRAADMASVMGVDMQMAMDSVAGAAKGNFTMMDNLGVAMNATNIQAYALEKGMNFKWNTATQAQKAEVAMQMFFEKTEQYAGNFAREATETVTGSFGLWKASLASFVAGLGNEKADMTVLTGNVVDAAKTVIKNVKPILKNAVNALPKAIAAAIPGLGPVFSSIGKYGGGAIRYIKQKWDQYGPGIVAFVMKAKDKAVSAFTWVKDIGQRAVAGIQDKYIEIKPHINDFIGAVIDIGSNIKDKLQGAFEIARPAIEWVATEGFPAVVGTAGDVLGKISDVYNFFKDNWNAISPIVWGIVGAFGAYKAITLGIAAVEAVKTGAMVAATAVTAGLTWAQAALNAVFIASPIGWIVLGIGALIAIGVLLYKNWDVIKAKAIELWGGLKNAFGSAVGWFKGIWDGVTATFQTFMDGLSQKFPMLADLISVPINAIKGYIDGLKMTFTGIIDFVAGVFTGDWTRAWEGVKGIFGGIFHSFASLAKTPINAVIAIINGAIRGINKINVDVPDWVPVLGGKSYGFSIPEIPMLAEGGIATKPTFAMIGEGRENEAIMPLSKLQNMLNFNTGPIAALIEKFLSLTGGGGYSGGGGGSEPAQIIYSPQYAFYGPTDQKMVESAQKDDYNRFVRFFKQYERDKKRKGLNT